MDPCFSGRRYSDDGDDGDDGDHDNKEKLENQDDDDSVFFKRRRCVCHNVVHSGSVFFWGLSLSRLLRKLAATENDIIIHDDDDDCRLEFGSRGNWRTMGWTFRWAVKDKKDAANQHCRENIKNNVQKKTYDFGKL